MKIIFDVDGTLMDIETRRKWLEGPTPNWTKFMDPKEMETDTPNQHVMEVAECMHDAGHEIVIVSARNERHREVTEHQLKQNFGVFWSHMFLRPDDSFEPDNQFKQEFLMSLSKLTGNQTWSLTTETKLLKCGELTASNVFKLQKETFNG